MVTVSGELVIARPLDETFDFVADQRNEPRYNRRMARAEKVSAGPIGPGTRFHAESTSLGRRVPMTIELVAYERPRLLRSRTRLASMDIDGMLTFEPVARGTRMTWSWELEPRGALRFAGPLVRRLGERQERRIWDDLRGLLEGRPARSGGAALDFGRSARRWARRPAAGRIASPRRHVGQRLSLEDGSPSLIFRETLLRGAGTSEPTLLVIRFQPVVLGRSRLLHAAFRRECVLHTPLFAGFPGFRSKLWIDDPVTGVCRGVYEWDGAGRACAYAERMVALLAPLSTAGSTGYEIVGGLSRDELLAAGRAGRRP